MSSEEPYRPDRPWGETRQFTPRPPVVWLSPVELARAGIKAVVAKTFGDFTDRRETFAGVGPVMPKTVTPATNPELLGLVDHRSDTKRGEPFWFDYVADVGDGFSATYAIAQRIAQWRLFPGEEPCPDTYDPGRFESSEPALGPLHQGSLLVFGGDEVYPAPVRSVEKDAYRDRTTGPYELALPYQYPSRRTAGSDGQSGLAAYAIPGNHDWYDGLVSFSKQFCTRQWIGAWRTEQQRSYFAVPLPHRWWLWGIDSAFEGPMDAPQLEWFTKVSGLLKPGDAVILCTAKPGWLECTDEDQHEYDLIRQFVSHTIEPRHASVPLMLSGDKHYYARYRDDHGRYKVVSGGGGASLSTTQRVSTDFTVSEADDPTPVRYRDCVAWPTPSKSRGGISFSVFGRMPRTWSFGLLLAAVYALGIYLMRLAVGQYHGGPHKLRETIRHVGNNDWIDIVDKVIDRSLASTRFCVFLLAVSGLMIALAIVGIPKRSNVPRGARKPLACLFGVVHGVAHWAAMVAIAATAILLGSQHSRLAIVGSFGAALTAGVVIFFLTRKDNAPASRKHLALVGFGILAVGSFIVWQWTRVPRDRAGMGYILPFLVLSYLIAWVIFAAYLYVVQFAKWNTTELAAALRHEGWKSFLRIRVEPDGVTVHSLGLETIGRQSLSWGEDESGSVHGQVDGHVPKCELIDYFTVPFPPPPSNPADGRRRASSTVKKSTVKRAAAKKAAAKKRTRRTSA